MQLPIDCRRMIVGRSNWKTRAPSFGFAHQQTHLNKPPNFSRCQNEFFIMFYFDLIHAIDHKEQKNIINNDQNKNKNTKTNFVLKTNRKWYHLIAAKNKKIIAPLCSSKKTYYRAQTHRCWKLISCSFIFNYRIQSNGTTNYS